MGPRSFGWDALTLLSETAGAEMAKDEGSQCELWSNTYYAAYPHEAGRSRQWQPHGITLPGRLALASLLYGKRSISKSRRNALDAHAKALSRVNPEEAANIRQW